MSKPQSMPTGERNVLRSNDSASLWNCTLSPGWTQEEVDILRLALMKFGIGNWIKIVDSQCLVGKTIAQMNLQTQRMLGQQSTAEFANLHIDPLVIGKINSQKQGPHIKRKNNFIVNTGGKLSKEERLKRHQENKKLYSLSREVINNIVLPTANLANSSVLDMEAELELLKSELATVRQKIAAIRDRKSTQKAPTSSKGSPLSRESADSETALQQTTASHSPIRRTPKIILKIKPRLSSPNSSHSSEDFETFKPNPRTSVPKRVYVSESDEYNGSDDSVDWQPRKRRNYS